jgi:hypothetical protein
MKDVRLIQLPRVVDTRGSLTFAESQSQIPFDIKRVYYIYDVPAGESRGAHAHKNLEQVIIAASGSFDVLLSRGQVQETYSLNLPFVGLYVPRLTWRDVKNFSSGSVCLVFASELYDEKDYLRSYPEYLAEFIASGIDH